MLSLAVVSITAYVIATLLKSKPIYESLLERLLKKQGYQAEENSAHGQKVLTNFTVQEGSRLEEALVSEIVWPENCLLVAIQRGSEEIIPKGRTKLFVGDVIVTMTDERDMARVHDQMEVLCKEM